MTGAAASMARFMSAFEASETSPRISSFAGLTLSERCLPSPSTSLPSISILDSNVAFERSAMVCAFPSRVRRTAECPSSAGSSGAVPPPAIKRLPINNIRASGPTAVLTNGFELASAFARPSANFSGGPGRAFHHRPPALVHRAVVGSIGSVQITVVRRSRVGDDLGVVRSR